MAASTEPNIAPILPEAEKPAEPVDSFGARGLAYVRPVRCEEAATLYPRMPYLSPWFTLFALHAADGELLSLSDSREEALKDASSRTLVMVGLH
jgi:hypothetical protein